MRRRQAWFEAQPGLDPERLVFVDETGASTKKARRCGRALRGQRCQASVPHALEAYKGESQRKRNKPPPLGGNDKCGDPARRPGPWAPAPPTQAAPPERAAAC